MTERILPTPSNPVYIVVTHTGKVLTRVDEGVWEFTTNADTGITFTDWVSAETAARLVADTTMDEKVLIAEVRVKNAERKLIVAP